MMEADQEPNEQAPDVAEVGRNKKIIVGLLLVGLLAVAIWLFRGSVGWPVASALDGEVDADISVYRKNLISTSEIVFDVRNVEPSESAVGMTRKLLKAAEALQDNKFDRVYLAYQGDSKFYLEGAYFQRLGRERSWQNPVFTIRTMPENVKNIDGSPAFERWTGGLIGVMGAQMEDSNELHRNWWISDALESL